MTNKQLIIKEFRRIKKLGFVKSRRRSNTGIGKTFEDYIGVEENNIDKPDFAGYEIKAHREISSSYVTLFTKAPSFPKGANTYLKDTYGTPSFTKFLNMIDKGLIMYDIRIGSYKTGKNIGKTHDHGSGFRILEKNLKTLYSASESVE